MIYVLVRHKVADFSKWREVYDSDAPSRQKSGLKELHVFRNMSNPNEVVLLFSATDLQKAQAFGNSPGLAEKMQAAGVVDKPDMFFLE
jgi:hypothetical protein